MDDYLPWTHMLTVRVPAAINADEVSAIIQAEVIGPLSRLVSRDLNASCRICGVGVTTRHHGRHGHILIHATQALPLINYEQAPQEYVRIRCRLRQSQHSKTSRLTNGHHTIELTPIRSMTGSICYIDDHFNKFADAAQITFSDKHIRRLFEQLQAA